MSFEEYLNEVEALLKSKYGLTLSDIGIEFENNVGNGYKEMSPEDFVNWFGAKYNLIENDSHSNNQREDSIV